MNSTGQNVGIEYANGPQARTIFSFEIDGFASSRGSTQAIGNELNDALASATNNKDIDRLTDAIRKLDDASNPDVWLPDGNHLVCTQGNAIFNRYKDAVQKLMDVIRNTSTPEVPDATIQNWINVLVAIDRDLAQTAMRAEGWGGITGGLTEDHHGDAELVKPRIRVLHHPEPELLSGRFFLDHDQRHTMTRGPSYRCRPIAISSENSITDRVFPTWERRNMANSTAEWTTELNRRGRRTCPVMVGLI